jgi:hypothetical protein
VLWFLTAVTEGREGSVFWCFGELLTCEFKRGRYIPCDLVKNKIQRTAFYHFHLMLFGVFMFAFLPPPPPLSLSRAR